MFLLFNTIINSKAQDNFTTIIAERISFGKEYVVLTLDEKIPDLNKFSHLLITGSELSASAGSKCDEKIISVINTFKILSQI